MVDFINTILSYNFIPEIIETFKEFIIHSGFAFILFIVLALITIILKGSIRTFFCILTLLSGIYLSITLLISSACVILLPTLFCVIGTKNGLISTFEIPELPASIISILFGMIILGLITTVMTKDK